MPPRKGLHGPGAGRGPEAHPRALSLVPQAFRVAIALGLHPGVLEVALARERALEPIQKLGGRIDLVVVLAVWKDRDLVRYSASQEASSGIRTKPFSISAVCACSRMILSVVGW